MVTTVLFAYVHRAFILYYYMKHSLMAANLEILQTLNPVQSSVHTDVGWQYLYRVAHLLVAADELHERPST